MQLSKVNQCISWEVIIIIYVVHAKANMVKWMMNIFIEINTEYNRLFKNTSSILMMIYAMLNIGLLKLKHFEYKESASARNCCILKNIPKYYYL